MEDAVVLTDIPLKPDPPALMEKLRLKPGTARAESLCRMAEDASVLARPKAMYRPCGIDTRGKDYLGTGGVVFRSRVLAVNLEKVHRFFPFVATCGRELETWSRGLGGALERYWAEEIKGIALGTAVLTVAAHIQEHHCPGPISMMNPGSLEDWPVSEQAPLFRTLGDQTESALGVALLENFLMQPGMTASGIWFPSEQRFENCMLCPREGCVGRRAPHDPELYDKRYRPRKGTE